MSDASVLPATSEELIARMRTTIRQQQDRIGVLELALDRLKSIDAPAPRAGRASPKAAELRAEVRKLNKRIDTLTSTVARLQEENSRLKSRQHA